MTDETDKRTEAMHRAAEFRQRAATYESLAAEAQRNGDTQASIEFIRKAAEEELEASRIEESISKLGGKRA